MAGYLFVGILWFLLAVGGGPVWAESPSPFPLKALEHFRKADTLQRDGDLSGAIQEYRKALALAPDRPELHYNLGIALDLQGDPQGAEAELRRTIELDPEYVDAYVYLGTVLHQRGSLGEAVALYRKALRLDPNHAGAHANLGVALKSQGDLEGAIRQYRQALALDPESTVARHNLDLALQEQKAKQSKQPERPPAVQRQTKELAQEGIREEEIPEAFAPDAPKPAKASVASDLPPSPVSVLRTAKQERPPRSVLGRRQGEIPRVSVHTNSPQALLHFRIGRALEAKGDLARAKREYREAQAYDPRFAAAYCRMGFLLEKEGDPRGASVYLRRCLKLAPNDPHAPRVRDRLARLGQAEP